MDRRTMLAAMGVASVSYTSGAPAEAQHDKMAATTQNPMASSHLYLCAFHIAKSDPNIAIEAHHFCMPVRDEVHQCVIFDNTTKTGRILGVEYIISDALYRALPDQEKKYYHPHAYEVTSGLLIAPDLNVVDENKLMEGILTTWGKTWHTWPDPKAALPMGEPLLMWAATKDGHISTEALDARDKKLRISTSDVRKRRAYIGPVPVVDTPKSINDIGRQWTNDGPDVPAR